MERLYGREEDIEYDEMVVDNEGGRKLVHVSANGHATDNYVENMIGQCWTERLRNANYFDPK